MMPSFTLMKPPARIAVYLMRCTDSVFEMFAKRGESAGNDRLKGIGAADAYTIGSGMTSYLELAFERRIE